MKKPCPLRLPPGRRWCCIVLPIDREHLPSGREDHLRQYGCIFWQVGEIPKHSLRHRELFYRHAAGAADAANLHTGGRCVVDGNFSD